MSFCLLEAPRRALAAMGLDAFLEFVAAATAGARRAKSRARAPDMGDVASGEKVDVDTTGALTVRSSSSLSSTASLTSMVGRTMARIACTSDFDSGRDSMRDDSMREKLVGGR